MLLRLPLCALLALCHATFAQQTNPVDRKVTNPITDTPNINVITPDEPIVRPRRDSSSSIPAAATTPEASDTFAVDYEKQTVTGTENARVFVYEGNVDARVGIYRLQADKVTVYEATNLVVAEGNVVFDQGEAERITGTRAEWNYATKLGFFIDSTGFTNQTQDGTVIYFTADRVDKTGLNLIVATNVELTACEDNVPKWSFRTARAEIRPNDRVRFRGSTFRIKNRPVAYLPFGSLSLKQRDRASGFLTPTFSFSGNKGFRISNAYYQTLGRSADITLRNDLYFSRGIGLGADLRTTANSRSYFNAGFYNVKDRIFGSGPTAENPDQGGSSFYADGVHFFSNGFTAVADVNITSNLAFRQIFSDTIQQAISPEERSQVYLNKNVRDYSLNLLARTEVTSIQTARIRTRQLPSVSLDKRPSILGVFQKLPIYFSFESGLEGVSRKETIENQAAFELEGDVDDVAVITPSVVQRLDFSPRVSVPLSVKDWMVTASANLRATYYSNSLDPATRNVLGRDLLRGYGLFELDVRPPALARNFRDDNNEFRFRHTIEPYLTYRKIEGVSDFRRTILFDYKDAIVDTNELEYGVTNRFFTRRIPGLSGRRAALAAAAKAARQQVAVVTTPTAAVNDSSTNQPTTQSPGQAPTSTAPSSGAGTISPPTTSPTTALSTSEAASAAAAAGNSSEAVKSDTVASEGAPNGLTGVATTNPLTGSGASSTTGGGTAATNTELLGQPYEALSITVRGKYFFDPSFGNAIVPGRRNQFYPINTFSGFSYGGVPRHFSPVNVEVRLRPQAELYADTRLNFDLRHGVRDLAVSFGLRRKLVEAFQTFYYTRSLALAPSVSAVYGDRLTGKEPGTLRGSQWSPSVFVGDRNRGLFGGASFFFDFQNRPDQGNSSLISSTATLGYAFDCCAVTVQNYSFNVGLRNERRFLFAFRLNGIGAFGTDQIGQRFR